MHKQQCQQGLSLKSYSIRTCMHTLLNQYTKSHYLAICINHMQLHEVTRWAHVQDFIFASMDDPNNNELCVRLIVHLAMDGHPQAIQAACSTFCYWLWHCLQNCKMIVNQYKSIIHYVTVCVLCCRSYAIKAQSICLRLLAAVFCFFAGLLGGA